MEIARRALVSGCLSSKDEPLGYLDLPEREEEVSVLFITHAKGLQGQAMKRVSVVFTEHEESGLASASGLLAILERITPEVIFLECPLAAFDNYLNGTQATLEPTAANRYRENHRVDLIPVDLPTPDADFFAKHQHLHKRMGRTSPDYRRLVDWHSENVSARGFAYLNSKDCSYLFSELHEAMLAAIEKDVDHRLLAEVYDRWIRTNELRGRAMMSNIENHCRQASFSSAAFLVGAGHRQSIIDLSRSEPGAASSTIQWEFASFLVEPSLTVARHNEEL